MPRPHVLTVHHHCRNELCPICSGGLASCDVCGGAEGTLPTHCPGRFMTPTEQDDVYASLLDFVDGDWVDPSSAGFVPMERRRPLFPG